jgi:SAM-dependent methyltransferase
MRLVPPARDGFGRHLWAHFKGGPPYEIIERDDGLVSASRATVGYFLPVPRWPKHQRRAMRFLRGRRALDIGCGAGKVALYLQERGMAVTAIDNSPLAVRVCRARGVEGARVLSIESVGRLQAGKYGTVLLMGNNVGLLGGRAKGQRLLRALHRVTAPGAVLLAESTDPAAFDNPVERRYRRRNRLRGRMPGQHRLRIRFQAWRSAWFDFLFVSPGELEALLVGTGWAVRRLLPEVGSPRYVAVVDRI